MKVKELKEYLNKLDKEDLDMEIIAEGTGSKYTGIEYVENDKDDEYIVLGIDTII